MPTPDYTALTKSIDDSANTIKSSNREVRDQIEGLTKEHHEQTAALAAKVGELTQAIREESDSSGRLTKAMVWLTVVIAIAAIAQAIAAFRNQKQNPQPAGGAYFEPAAGSKSAHP